MDVLDTTMLSHAHAFKDDHPGNTVEKIKKILAHHGIQTVERWGDSGVPYCYSLRVSVMGTAFGTNGKGVTKELALASGYGELMERLQLGWIFKEDQQKENELLVDASSVIPIPQTELLERNGKWYSLFADGLFRFSGETLTGEQILAQYANAQGMVNTIPYYCVNRRTQEFLPVDIKKTVYSTNGCAAGNTTEEALVQAISEIVERNYQLRILEQGIAVPDVPEEVLQTFTVSYQIITFLRENGFQVSVKDCSLGDKFPVICVCLVDTSSGKYHTHFGAAPKLEIAVERTLTECFQGRTRERVCEFENFCNQAEDALKREYLVQDLVKGTSERAPTFFLADNTKPFNDKVGFVGTDNRELLKECFAFFTEKGYDILVRDGASLGFPTCQVIIPGYSEVFPYRFSAKQNELRFRSSVKKVLRDPSAANIMDLMGFVNHVSQYSQSGLTRGFCKDANLAAELTWQEERYLYNAALSHVFYTLNRIGNVISTITGMIPLAKAEDAEYLICLKRYLTMTANGQQPETIRSVLDYFHKKDTVATLYQKLEKKQNPLDPVVVHCNEQCGEHCKLFACCKKKETDQLGQMMQKKIRELDQAQIAQYLESF